ncbi:MULTISPECIES: succinoglycan biosynthesis transport protein [unclassified Rhizobium]|uniref:succinoglycan biosynthesis transport protein n=1 Tax=unclassified Rhizobium TaxID=2613769 RepID=UPI000EA8B488|nr:MULTISPECIES: succinoglycan biosynthesis transport protein [unclassified Rhizobium]AYG65230.1 succinoglycan biosynthesis transport protein [Rhizobium sp. CCGE531]AYG71714.1 succinoglycan biosynthesis transport protein [Rhizobium sp. CCGE532]
MFESKARPGFYPDDAETFEVSRGPGRHVSPRRGEDGLRRTAHLRAANSDDPRDTELRAILRRALDGDPYPVSGRGGLVGAGPSDYRPALAHIQDAQMFRHAEHEQTREPASEPVPDLLEFVPDLLEAVPELPSQTAIPNLAEHRPRAGRWSPGIRSLGFVIIAALAGAAVPTMLASPPLYMSQAVLHAEGEGGGRQTLLDVAAKRAVAPSVLSDVVARMKLDHDPEFTGSRAGALGVAAELLSGSGNASDAPSRAQATLRKSIAVGIDGQTGLLRLTVMSGDPARSADIANRLAGATLYDAAVAKAAGTSLGLETAADRSRKEFDRASAALAEFKARHGEDKIAAALALQQQRQQLDGEIKAAELTVRAARSRLASVKSATPASVLSGALPGDLASAGLDDLRSRYSAAKAQLSQLGPRHPRLLAQQATVDDLAANMRSQLQRLVVSSDADVKAAVEKQRALSAEMTALSQKNIDVDVISLAQLQDAAAVAKSRYEADQQNATLSVPEAKQPLTLISQAVASALPLDDHLASNQAISFLAALGMALGAIFLRRWLAGAEAAEDYMADDGVMPAMPSFHRDSDMSLPPLPAIALEPPAAVPEIGSGPDVADEWVRIQRELASLRAKVEIYAVRRHQEHG